MLVEVGGIGLAVALYVRSVGIFWIGPPVVALGEVVVLAARAARGAIRGDGDGLLGQVSPRGFEHTLPLYGSQIGDRAGDGWQGRRKRANGRSRECRSHRHAKLTPRNHCR